MSVEKIEKLTEEAKKENLFKRKKEVEVAGKKYVIRRPTRAEFFDSRINYLSSLLTKLDAQIEKETDLEKKKKLIEEREQINYEFEKKILMLCVEGMTEEKLNDLDYAEWYQLFNEVNFFVVLAPLEVLRKGRGSSQNEMLATL